MMNTGELIKKLRKEKGMTQEELGKLLGKNRAAINKMESGATVNFKRDTLLKLSEIFNITVTDLLQSDKPKPTHKRIPVLGKVAAGVPINVARELMGHSDISITSKIYTHSSTESFDSAADAINRLDRERGKNVENNFDVVENV